MVLTVPKKEVDLFKKLKKAGLTEPQAIKAARQATKKKKKRTMSLEAGFGGFRF